MLTYLIGGMLLLAGQLDDPASVRWPDHAESLEDWPIEFFSEDQVRTFVGDHDMEAWLPSLCDALVSPSTLDTRLPMFAFAVGMAKRPQSEECLRRHIRYLFSEPADKQRVRTMRFAIYALGFLGTPTSLQTVAEMAEESYWSAPRFADAKIHETWESLSAVDVQQQTTAAWMALGVSGTNEGARLIERLRTDMADASPAAKDRVQHNVSVALEELSKREDGVPVVEESDYSPVLPPGSAVPYTGRSGKPLNESE